MKKSNMKYYLAIDLGASSGRHIIGYKENGDIKLVEVYRFKTGMDESKDGLVWDIPRIYKEILKGIKFAFKKYPKIESLSIDTWGVDYVLMNIDKEITPYYAYRNIRNEESSKKVNEILGFDELYKKTGIQFASFNTIYQLYDDLKKGRLDNASDYLMLPSYFTYKLTGVKSHEYTNESTGALLDAFKEEYDFELIDKLSLPRKLFNKIDKPGKYIGTLTEEISKKVGGNCNVYLCASHDTASAFESIEVPNDGVIISSGTWSLLGIKSDKPIINKVGKEANYTNEGGVNYIRFLKNIMGMWIANQVKNELLYTQEFVDMHINSSNYEEIFDVNDPSLLAPPSMLDAVKALLINKPPKDNFDIFSSIYKSMAVAYKKAIDELEEITGRKYSSIHIVGGGAKNNYLNKMIEKYTGRKVVPIPIEATALGNIKVQMKGNNDL